jgi:iron complex transport system substrate-binding protein
VDVIPIRNDRLAEIAVLAGIVLSACGGPGGPAPRAEPPPQSPRLTGASTIGPSPSPLAITRTDDDGVTVTLARSPERIVTWAPSSTEILFALGIGDRVVGVSGPFDDYPPAANGIEEVAGAGGVEPNVEAVVGLEPDLVLNGFLGGDEWKTRLRDVGVEVFSIYATDFEDAVEDIETVGALTGTEPRAASVAAGMRTAADDIRAAVATENRVTCFFEVGYPDLYTVGPQDFPFDLLEIAGCDPVTEGAEGPYPQWSVERLVQDDPDVYILTTEAGTSAQDVARRPGFERLSAVTSGRVLLIDSDLITRPGPRLVDGLRTLAEGLHPGAFP